MNLLRPMRVFAVEASVGRFEEVSIGVRIVEVKVYIMLLAVLGLGLIPKVRVEMRFALLVPCDMRASVDVVVGDREEVSI